MKRHSIAAALAAAVAVPLASPTLAGSLDTPAPSDPVYAPAPAPLPASSNWGGFYGGGQVGYGDLGADVSGSGWLGGVHAGYNWEFGNTVVGIEGDYDVTDIDIGGGPDSLDNVARLKLRAGYATGPTLFYATAGAAYADATVGGADLSDSGWFGGVGVGYQVTDKLVVGGEVLSHSFDDFDGSGLDVDATTATLRASFRF
jgi:outer membrane immunogenic protein